MKNIKQIIVLVITVTATVLITLCFAKKILKPVAEEIQEVEQKTAVVVTAVTAKTFERTASVQGNLESKNYALVSPRIMGTIESFFVDEGNSVVANESKLFATDSAALE